MISQPLDNIVAVVSDWRRWRIRHMFENGVKYRASILYEPLDMLCTRTVDIRDEE